MKPQGVGKKELLVGGVLCVLVILWGCRDIGICRHPIVYQDEVGYWTNAAVFARKDWSGVSDGLVWYSYGYSLLLAPILLIFPTPELQYQAAVVLNAVMLGVLLLLFRRILRKLFPSQNTLLLWLPAMAGVLYAPYQVYSHTTWAETAVLLSVTLTGDLLLSLLQKPTFSKAILLGCISSYSFMVHNRCIGVVGAVCLTLVLTVLLKKLPLRYLLCAAAVLVVGFGIHFAIKAWLTDTLWVTSPPAANDAGNVLGKLKNVFTSDGAPLWASLFLSQGMACIGSGACLPLAAIIYLCSRIIRHGVKREFRPETFFSLFLVTSFLFMLMISSVFMMTYDRIDQIIYTRYVDCLTGLLMAMGICVLCEKKQHRLMPVLLLLLPVLLCLWANRAEVLTAHLGTGLFNKLCAPYFDWYYDRFHTVYFAYIFLMGTPMLLFMGIRMLLRNRRKTVCIFVTAACTGLSMLYAAGGMETIQHQNTIQDMRAQQLRILKRSMSDEVLYIAGDDGYLPYFAQLLLQDRRCVTVEEGEDIPENVLVLCKQEDFVTDSGYHVEQETDEYVLFRTSYRSD